MQDRTRSRVTAEKVCTTLAPVGSPHAPLHLPAHVVWDRWRARATQGLLSARTADGGLVFRRYTGPVVAAMKSLGCPRSVSASITPFQRHSIPELRRT